MCDSLKSCAIPIVRDGIDVVVTDCATEEGGTQTVGVPEYSMAVKNPPELSDE
jgi:hypothetical protein